MTDRETAERIAIHALGWGDRAELTDEQRLHFEFAASAIEDALTARSATPASPPAPGLAEAARITGTVDVCEGANGEVVCIVDPHGAMIPGCFPKWPDAKDGDEVTVIAYRRAADSGLDKAAMLRRIEAMSPEERQSLMDMCNAIRAALPAKETNNG